MTPATSFPEPASLGMQSLKKRRVSSIITVAKTLSDKQRTTLSLPLLSVYLLLGSFIAALGKVIVLLLIELCAQGKCCTQALHTMQLCMLYNATDHASS